MKIILTYLLVLYSTTSFAWGFRAHVLTAEIAFETLTTDNKIKAMNFTNLIYKHLSPKLKKQLNRNYKTASRFARLAPLPDTWRELTVKEIFLRFHANTPHSLAPYANELTTTWHYINLPANKTVCPLPNTTNIIIAINTLIKAWKETKSPQAHAVIMVLLEHLIGDAHQPLHTFTRYNKNCSSDAGGNTHTIYAGKYPMTLHTLWDQGVGYFFHKFNYKKKALRLQHEFPRNQFHSILKSQNPTDWVRIDQNLSGFIYSAQANQRINADYYRKGQRITRKQIALGGYQLAAVLADLFQITKSKN